MPAHYDIEPYDPCPCGSGKKYKFCCAGKRKEEGSHGKFGWPQAEYRRLKTTQPSYRDRFDLLSLSRDEFSEWMMFPGEDITAHVRRKSDGKEFVLGLAELKATDKKSSNCQLIDDFGVWLVNNR